MGKTAAAAPAYTSVAVADVSTSEMPTGVPASGGVPICAGMTATSAPHEPTPTRLFRTSLLSAWPLHAPVRYSRKRSKPVGSGAGAEKPQFQHVAPPGQT